MANEMTRPQLEEAYARLKSENEDLREELRLSQQNEKILIEVAEFKKLVKDIPKEVEEIWIIEMQKRKNTIADLSITRKRVFDGIGALKEKISKMPDGALENLKISRADLLKELQYIEKEAKTTFRSCEDAIVDKKENLFNWSSIVALLKAARKPFFSAIAKAVAGPALASALYLALEIYSDEGLTWDHIKGALAIFQNTISSNCTPLRAISSAFEFLTKIDVPNSAKQWFLGIVIELRAEANGHDHYGVA